MYCKKCGNEIPNDALFCPNCSSLSEIGARVKENSPLPPIPPSFTRPIPESDLSRSRRKKLKSPASRGTGCLVFSLVFLLLCIGFVASLFISDKIKEKSLAESVVSSKTETSVVESSSTLQTETKTETTASQSVTDHNRKTKKTETEN